MTENEHGLESPYTRGEGNTLSRAAPAPRRVDALPQYRVLLHNDDVNELVYVIETVFRVCRVHKHRAVEVSLEAHAMGISLVTETHREHAELIRERLLGNGLTVTIEPSD